MTRGKYAARATGRREAAEVEASEAAYRRQIVRLTAERNEAREAYSKLKTDTSTEARMLRAQINEGTSDRVEALRRQLASLREKRGFSDDLLYGQMYQKDMLVMNACRYLSMTEGVGPNSALAIVIAWATNENFDWTLPIPKILLLLGVPSDGWVAQMLNTDKTWNKIAYIRRGSRAISLDQAEADGDDRIHKDYQPRWYPKTKHGGIVIDNREGRESA